MADFDSDSSSEDENFDAEAVISRDFELEKQQIMRNLLPNRSRAAYELAYSKFLLWKDKNKASRIDENMLIVYFSELIQKFKPSPFGVFGRNYVRPLVYVTM